MEAAVQSTPRPTQTEGVEEINSTYFQRQTLGHCMKHAVNNCMGRTLLHSTDLSRVVSEKHKKGLTGGQRNFEGNVNGEWNVNVLTVALRRKGFRLEKWSGSHIMDRLLSPECKGKHLLLTNFCEDISLRQRHWISVDCDRRLIFDSLNRRGPDQLSKETLRRSVRLGIHRTYAIIEEFPVMKTLPRTLINGETEPTLPTLPHPAPGDMCKPALSLFTCSDGRNAGESPNT